MSGFTTTTIRANAPNTFFVTPYNGEVAPEPQIRPAKCPVYEPLHRRKHSGTKYDVRSTYSKDHTLRSPYRVIKPRTTRSSPPLSPRTALSPPRPSSASPSYPSPSSRCFAPHPLTEPSDTTLPPFHLSTLIQKFHAFYAFLTVDDTHIALEKAEREWNDRQLTLLQACAYKELWFEKAMQQPLGRAKRWAVRRALDGVVAAQMSVMEGAGSLGKYIEGNEEIGEMMERGREVVGQCESMAGQDDVFASAASDVVVIVV